VDRENSEALSSPDSVEIAVRDIARIPEASILDKSSLLPRFLFRGDRAQHARFHHLPAALAVASLNSESELLERLLLEHIYLSEKRPLRGPRRFVTPCKKVAA